jgi:ParB-like chromosome segregation protein Spo0J
MAQDIKKQPISSVVWKNRTDLKPNDYNPNKVAPPEMELLVTSIIEDGWTQPIVILPDNTIVDGFHRYTVSGQKKLMEKFNGMVPTVTVDIDPVHRQMSTIRHNRARGTHGILPMASIVRGIVDEGVSKEEIQARLGMEDEEVDRLIDRAGMPTIAGRKQDDFGASWKPKAKDVE